MFKTSLALILILLQGLSALPARLNLCFEASGEFCCVDGGEQGCRCQKHIEQPSECNGHQCCGHSEQDAAPESADEEVSKILRSSENGHRHVIIAVDAKESTLRVHASRIVEPPVVAIDFALPFEHTARVGKPEFALSQGDEPTQALSFSLIARASTVLRC